MKDLSLFFLMTYVLISTGASGQSELSWRGPLSNLQNETFFARSNDTIRTQFITDSSEDETLIGFMLDYVIDYGENNVAPYGLVKSDDKTFLYDLNIGEREVVKDEVEPVARAVLISDFIGEGSGVASVFDVNEGQEYLVNIDINQTYLSERMAASHLHFHALEWTGYSICLVVSYQGDLMFGDSFISRSARDTSLAILSIDYEGHLELRHTMKGVDWSRSQSVSRWVNGLCIGLYAKEHEIILDDSVVELSDRNYLLLGLESDFSVGRLKPLPGEKDNTYLDVVITKTGDFWTAEHNISGEVSELELVIHGVDDDEVAKQTFEIPSLVPELFDFDCIHDSYNSICEAIVGITFSEAATIDDQIYESRGGTDILIMKLDRNFDVEWVNQYGEQFDETVSNVVATFVGYFNSYYFFFGGEFSTKIFRRQLGDVEIINTKRGIKKAYISYIVKESNSRFSPLFAEVGDVQNTAIAKESSEAEIALKPNPFKSDFVLEYDRPDAKRLWVKLTDVSGRVLYQENTSMQEGHIKWLVNFDFGKGIYFISMQDDLGLMSTRKILCLGQQ